MGKMQGGEGGMPGGMPGGQGTQGWQESNGSPKELSKKLWFKKD